MDNQVWVLMGKKFLHFKLESLGHNFWATLYLIVVLQASFPRYDRQSTCRS